MYNRYIIDLNKDASDEEREAFFKALGQLSAVTNVRYALGDSIANAKGLAFNAEGKITIVQG